MLKIVKYFVEYIFVASVWSIVFITNGLAEAVCSQVARPRVSLAVLASPGVNHHLTPPAFRPKQFYNRYTKYIGEFINTLPVTTNGCELG